MKTQIVVLGNPAQTDVASYAKLIENEASLAIACVKASTLQVICDYQDLDRTKVHLLAEQSGLDVFITTGPRRKCKLLVADMEATIIPDEMLDVIAAERGIGDLVAGITARTMNGEIDFAQSLIERTRLLAGTPEAQLRALSQKIRLNPGARSLVQTMRASGAQTLLVTGGYGIFAETVAQACGFDGVVANHPVMKDGVMTGELEAPICTAETKREIMRRHCDILGIDPYFACCIGDGANDVKMLQSCGLPISYKGKPVVQKIVDLNITKGDLTTALLAQGFGSSKVLDT